MDLSIGMAAIVTWDKEGDPTPSPTNIKSFDEKFLSRLLLREQQSDPKFLETTNTFSRAEALTKAGIHQDSGLLTHAASIHQDFAHNMQHQPVFRHKTRRRFLMYRYV